MTKQENDDNRHRPNVPPLRFRGFTAPWQRMRLGELLISNPYKDHIGTISKRQLYPIIQQGDAPILGYGEGDPILNYHDKVVWGDHTTSLFAPSEPFLVATDGVRILSIPGASQSFLLGLLEFARPTPQGYTRHFSLLAEKTISLPLSTKEQEKIGTFFRALDELIAAREEELEKLRQMKAALLEAMFPNDASVERERERERERE